MEIKFIIAVHFIFPVVFPSLHCSAPFPKTLNSASSIYMGYQHIDKKKSKQGGRYKRLTRVYCSGKMEIDASREAFGFARDVIGSTIRCTIVNKLS